jgi:hypothetical protein
VVDGATDRVLVGDIPSSEAILKLGTREGSVEAQPVSLGDVACELGTVMLMIWRWFLTIQMRCWRWSLWKLFWRMC